LDNSEILDSETWEVEVNKNSQLLVRALADFGIESRIVNVNRGPVITLYEMQIAAGIKINRVVSLADDIAMALAAYRVRIVAPIPGKSAIGVELPNTKREMVTLGDIIKSKSYKEQKGTLKVALGKDVLGAPVTIDLKNQPHLLIAGATGAGKSVCVNSIITSIVYNYDPNYVRFILVDPKMVELQLYNGTPHLLTPVITEPHLAPAVLKWSIFEMERRYRLLAAMNTRDILSYNDKISKARKGGEKIPFIIIIIDELADLMMVASKDIEGYITRIAQKARAVGIHLVLATQRPSVDVITGIIKANFPARIAFQVAQKTDSRTIIDQNGAEKLLGKGDMLYQSPMSSYPVRIQGAFISEDEVMAVVTHLRTLGAPDYIDFEESVFQDEDGELNEENDELFVEALKIIEETRKASASYLQRRLSIGYNRAARIIEKMEELGYIGPQQGSKPRDIYI
jgi:S-DNA-T family DNA segregation ATPase FtsK/SpoIIIE